MSTAATTTPRVPMPAKFHNAAEGLHALGDISPQRIVMDPWPGTATDEDLIQLVGRGERLAELIDGTLVEKVPGFYESLIATQLLCHLSNWAHNNKRGIIIGGKAMIR